jgi:hypothetical protein
VQALTKQLEAEIKKCKAKSDASDKYMKVCLDQLQFQNLI